MTPDEKLDAILEAQSKQGTMLTEINTTLFGVRQQGGIIRDIEKLQTTVSGHEQLKWKAAGGVLVIGFIVSIAFKLAEKFL